ncbi:DHHW family protein [Ureibacillus acetophenoni]|uniref:Acetyltransferase AlgX (SGNH hydrolase-like protein) n=1 Tax=Ureibacillus acetophenoni TaxID=614649 RepID=A0A285U310_9BACL|nr:DHHW family protein [Ureibacillus acetophenoni]SOC34876.1 acetyltransferase AlgX (SGNH hydrolase-like protein) [Ureibacillus acetophenoni]
MKKLGNYLLTLLFIGFIFGIGAYMQFGEKEEISFYENRTLAKSPELSIEKVVDASFSKDYESYFTDHFYEKGEWVKGYIQWQRLTGQTFIQDYFIDEDDWIYPKPGTYKNINKTVEYMNEFAEYTRERNIELMLFSLPNRFLILDPEYPSHVISGVEFANKRYFLNQFSKIEGLRVFNLAQTFRDQFTHEELKDMYYQTDHHWNVDGAFVGYKTIYNILNEESAYFDEPSFNENEFEKVCYEDEHFLGSYNRQLYELIETDDAVCTIMPTNFDFNDVEVYKGPIEQQFQVPWTDIYGTGLNKNQRVVAYGDIFTDDYREFSIINPAKAEVGTKVLFIKDSYANPMTFWLSQHFYQTTFYDIRHNQDRPLYQYLEENKFDMIVFLYNDTTVFPRMYNFNMEPDSYDF